VATYPTPDWAVSVAVSAKQTLPRSAYSINADELPAVWTKNKSTKNPFSLLKRNVEETMGDDEGMAPPNVYLLLFGNELIALRVTSGEK
jgi:hypothetical protein